MNNAGVLEVAPLAKLGVASLERILAVNLGGPLFVTRAVLPVMLRRRAGAIVNVASLLGKMGLAEYVAYCASKFGVVGFTEALADELGRTGVRVWAVCPGQVDTAMARKAGVTPRERASLIPPARAQPWTSPDDEGAGGRKRARTICDSVAEAAAVAGAQSGTTARISSTVASRISP